ncbi:MAG TPA: glycosyltransferase [Bacteroidia bacterium]|jgi:glycosyltransferase involved in cell wall biosynthesis|nr:glycosyltransferase [Bacteroidia bacterium]
MPKEPYRIVRIINRFNLGGPTYNVTYLTRYLSPEFETLLVGGMKEESEASSDFILKENGITPVIVEEMRRSINPMNDIAAYKKLKKIIKDFKPHIVHTHAAKSGTLGRLAAFSCKVPITVHTFHGHVFHSYFGGVQTAVYKSIERYLAARTTALVALSEKQKHELSDIHHIAPADKFHIVPLGFDLERFWTNQEAKRKAFREKYLLADNEIAIGIIGRLVPVKNHHLFLRAFKQIEDKTQTKVKAFIIGDGELKEQLMDYCKELGLSYTSEPNLDPSSSVVFTSWIKEADVATAGVDIITLSSLNEGTPVSLIEAQAASRPIVSTQTGGIENVVIPNETALLSPVNDENSFADNMLKLCNDNTLRTNLSFKGKDFAMAKFHYSSLVKNMGDLYLKLLKDKHAGAN